MPSSRHSQAYVGARRRRTPTAARDSLRPGRHWQNPTRKRVHRSRERRRRARSERGARCHTEAGRRTGRSPTRSSRSLGSSTATQRAVAHEKLRSAIAELVSGDVDEVTAHIALLIGLEGADEVRERRMLFLSARRFVEWLRGRTADDAGLRGSPLGGREHARPARGLRVTHPGPSAPARRSGPSGAPYGATRLGRRPACVHGAPPRTTEPRHTRASSPPSCWDGRSRMSRRRPRWPRLPEGNPLFIEELAASFAERATTGRLPTTVHGIISARLDALPADERTFLLDASVVGKTFWRGALEKLGLENWACAGDHRHARGTRPHKARADLTDSGRRADLVQAHAHPRRCVCDAAARRAPRRHAHRWRCSWRGRRRRRAQLPQPSPITGASLTSPAARCRS